MNTLTTVLAILVALEHLYIMFLETIATSSESTKPLRRVQKAHQECLASALTS